MFMSLVVGFGCFLESHITRVLRYTIDYVPSGATESNVLSITLKPLYTVIHGTWEEKFGDPA